MNSEKQHSPFMDAFQNAALNTDSFGSRDSDTPRSDCVFAASKEGSVYEFCQTLERELNAEHEAHISFMAKASDWCHDHKVAALATAARIEKLEGALRTHQDYIRYLHEADHMTVGFLHVHGWHYDSAFIQRGEVLRAALNPEETKGGGQ